MNCIAITNIYYRHPKVWNDLPLEIRTALTLSCFKATLILSISEVFPSVVFQRLSPGFDIYKHFTIFDLCIIFWMMCLTIHYYGD